MGDYENYVKRANNNLTLVTQCSLTVENMLELAKVQAILALAEATRSRE